MGGAFVGDVLLAVCCDWCTGLLLPPGRGDALISGLPGS